MAADYYVDRDVIDTTNTCTMAQPCDQISEALGLADANDSSTDTVHVGRSTGAYGAVTVPNTPVTLLGGEFNAGADGIASTIDGNTESGVFLDASSFPRTVEGLTIEGGDTTDPVCALQDSGSTRVTIQKNVFDETSTQLDGHICIDGSPVIRDNKVFGNDQPEGIQVLSAISPQVTGNTIQGVERPIRMESGGTTMATIKDNILQVLGVSSPPAAGIYLKGASGEISGNKISLNPASTLGTNGIYAAINSSGGTLRLSRNSVFGFSSASSRGMHLATSDPITLDNDVVADTTIGVAVFGNGPSLSITNMTIWNSASAEIQFFGNPMSATIDSSIIGNAGVVNSSGSTCSSTFSRGPSGMLFCGPFATSAAPAFVNAGVGDYHLNTSGNGSLIESGNPADPPPGVQDIDGQSRVIDFDGDCTARRDIGADEVPPATTPDCAAASGDTASPDTTISSLPVVRARRKRVLVLFSLTSTEPGSTFKCSLDGSPFLACINPVGLLLRRGTHSVTAVAIDKAGNIDPTPARFVVTVRGKKHQHGKAGGKGKKG